MTRDEYASALAKMVFTTSCPGSAIIYNAAKGTGECNILLKELIYLKSYLAYFSFMVVTNGTKTKEVQEIIKSMMLMLDKGFKNDPFGYGCNFNEMMDRFDEYLAKANMNEVALVREFTNKVVFYGMQVGLDLDDISNIAAISFKWMADRIEKMCYTSENKSSGCYVATATYQDEFHPNVILLRDYRDRYLRNSLPGRLFIRFYYTFGPYAAYFPTHSKKIRTLSKQLIDAIVATIKKKYYQ